MSKIYFETKQDKNELIDYLKIQSQNKDEILYGLLKEDGWQDKKQEEQKVVYKTESELNPEEHKSCANCYFNHSKEGCINKICPSSKDVIECIQKGHKYWRKKNDGQSA